jgi:O-antigen/teichoic acid export membrane protein
VRKNHFITGVAASYLALGATIIYGLALVPIALKYLAAEEFGLWMVLIQISTYLTLLELGMFPAAARILIDHKDDRCSSGAYGAAILSAAAIFALQSFLVLLVGYLLSGMVGVTLSVPPHLEAQASSLFMWFVVAAALGTFGRVWSAVLYANHRMDLVALIHGITPLLGLGIAWWVLAKGGGLAELPWAIVPPVVASTALSAVASCRLGLLPPKGAWQLPNFTDLQNLCRLGVDVFAVNIGQQLLQASQLLIVSRSLGLTAAAVWSVSTKLFALIYQMIIRVENTAIVSFAEMLVRGEKQRLRQRFRQVYQLTAALAVTGMGAAAALNAPFVTVWASSDLVWGGSNSVLLACLMTCNLLLHSHTDLIIHSKRIGALRYLILAEGIVFVLLALRVTPAFGFAGLLLVALLCALLFRGPYCLMRTATLLDLSRRTIAFHWLRPTLIGFFGVTAAAAAATLSASTVTSSWQQLGISSAILAPVLVVLFYFVLCPRDLHVELRQALVRLRPTRK